MFKNKKGSASSGGLVSAIIVVAFFMIFIWPDVKGKINSDDFKKEVPFLFSSTTDSGIDNSGDKDHSNNKSLGSDDYLSFDIDEAKKLAKKVKIEEANTEHDSNRSDWENSSLRFECPVSGKKSGVRNYSLEMTTGEAYNRDNFSYECPYSHEIVTDVKKIDYDHIIPINYVDSHGGWAWSKEDKQEYYYNIDNGICTFQSPNRKKSDKGPSKYLPDYNQEWYCYKWLEIATRYNIGISQADYDTIVDVLGI